MTPTPARPGPRLHRIDLPCEQTGFSAPPFDVHIKFLPAPTSGAWTLLAHAAAGRPEPLARWLQTHAGIQQVVVAPGIAPKLLRATTPVLPPAWSQVAAFVKVHHLDLASDGNATWFIEGDPQQVLQLMQHLAATQPVPGKPTVRSRSVQPQGPATITRRQFEALSAAVALGYYEIPHRLDLRALAAKTGVSLGSFSELLRRSESAVLSHYVDARLMWLADEGTDFPANLLRPNPQPPERQQVDSRASAASDGRQWQAP